MITFSLQYREAIKIAKKLAHSMSNEETRYYLKGFFMHKNSDGKHFAVSTDGHRLTRIEVNPVYEGEFPSVIFPREAVKQIVGIKLSAADKKKQLVTFQIDGLKYQIECLGQVAGGKLVDGTFPDYSRTIPAGYKDYTNEYRTEGFSSVYLAEVMEAASYDADHFKASSRAVRILFQGGYPAVILEEDATVLYILMPRRSSFPLHEHPKEAAADLAA